jgi:biofilm PGA synthesis lipoprotein PgaB
MRGLLSIFLAFAVTPLFAQSLHTLTYHDIRDQVAKNFDPDQYAVSSENLAAHFSWLRSQGYSVVDVDEILTANSGGLPLPKKAVLLTFDDGFRSVYTHVFPLLKLFGYTAVVSVVTEWIETEVNIDYNGRALTRNDFLTWAQIREMQGSGLVEIASHSHNLHRGIDANPQGNQQPAATTRHYRSGKYEDDAAYLARIESDLALSADLISHHTGSRPRVIAWPFGAWNKPIRSIAARHGMSLSLTLDEDRLEEELSVVGRDMLVSNPGIPLFAWLFQPSPQPRPVRAAQVDLDYVYDPDPQRQEANLGLLLDRMKSLEISHVFLQAFADPDADGAADALYFPNRHLPMRADLFNRVAWQLQTRSNVKVFAWMPLLSFSGNGIDPAWQVLQARHDNVAPDSESKPRLSPFEPAARKLIHEIYEDLAIYATFSGLHFDDDGRLNEFEDANPVAMATYSAALGSDFSITAVETDVELGERWATIKSSALTQFSLKLADTARAWRPGLKTSRNLFASALLDENAKRYLGQDYGEFLKNYDLVTVMAMPYLEGASDERRFYQQLIAAMKREPEGVQRTVFELQTVDWQKKRRLPAAQLRDTMRYLQAQGVRNLAYYPDDFISNEPELQQLKQGMSLAEFPARAGS